MIVRCYYFDISIAKIPISSKLNHSFNFSCLSCRSAGLVFIFGALICLLVWVTYLPGAPMEQLLCKNLRDPEYTIFTDVSSLFSFSSSNFDDLDEKIIQQGHPHREQTNADGTKNNNCYTNMAFCLRSSEYY